MLTRLIEKEYDMFFNSLYGHSYLSESNPATADWVNLYPDKSYKMSISYYSVLLCAYTNLDGRNGILIVRGIAVIVMREGVWILSRRVSSEYTPKSISLGTWFHSVG